MMLAVLAAPALMCGRKPKSADPGRPGSATKLQHRTAAPRKRGAALRAAVRPADHRRCGIGARSFHARRAGDVPSEEALQRLLAGTGLVYTSPSGTTISLQRAGQSGGGVAPGAVQLDPVQVQGYPVPPQAMIDNLPPPYAGGQVATGGQLGMLGNRAVMDTPFNQTSYTAKKAQDQQAKTVKDVLIDDPSVRPPYPTAASARITSIRGFPVVRGDMAYGGLYGMLPSFRSWPSWPSGSRC